MPDPCQSLVDKLNAITNEPVPTESNGKPQPGAVAQKEAAIAQAQAALAACRQAQLSVAVTGAPTPALSEFDAVVQKFMIGNQVALGQLTVIKNGAVLLAHGYTGSWTRHRKAEPTSLFRIASCSKAFTCAAIQNLFDAGSLKPSDRVFSLLGITKKALATQTPDPHIDDITVQNLIDHAGGWNDGPSFVIPQKTDIPGYPPGTTIPSSGYDPVFYTREIAQKLHLPGPPTKRDIARFMYGEPLQFKPGVLSFNNTSGKTYSNFGYVLLGLLVELESGMPYVDYVRKQVLAPIGIDDVFLSRMLAGPVYPREVAYDDPNTGPDAFQPDANATQNYVSGGADLVTELCDSGGGLMSTATALAQFIGQYPVWGIGHGRVMATRTGSEAGVSSLASSSSNGVDFAYVFNTRAFPPTALDNLNSALSSLVATL